MNHERYLQRALDIAETALSIEGAAPFAAVIVKDGEIVGEGLNRTGSSFDPTAHGEVEAIRHACRQLQALSLIGCTLYSSCEPCPLCISAMALTGIKSLIYAVSIPQAADILRDAMPGLADQVDAIRHEAGAPPEARLMRSIQLPSDQGVTLLRAWLPQLILRA